MSSSIAGELVTETFGYDGGRLVTVYVPPVPAEAVVFAGDVSHSRCPPGARRCLVFRRVQSSRLPWDFAIPTSTVRSSAHRRAEVTGRLP